MPEARLARADARGVDFSEAQLVLADFSGASLQGAVFRGAEVTDARFTSAQLDATDFRGALGKDKASWKGASGLPFGVDLRVVQNQPG
mmetsp:Transcript_33109/g.101074  ORF Transcript_33109/g.101074 Transcript_33109/m.101074 type:complete len:88 (+) Transcript_33109:1-264(+)